MMRALYFRLNTTSIYEYRNCKAWMSSIAPYKAWKRKNRNIQVSMVMTSLMISNCC